MECIYGQLMNAKNMVHSIGFRGQYQRGDSQIFLNKVKFGNVITLEPIHRLMQDYIKMDILLDELEKNMFESRE